MEYEDDQIVEFDQDKFSDWMKSARERKSLSLTALAHAAGLHPTAVGTIENDGRDVRMSTFVAICNALGQNPVAVLKKVLA